MDYQKINITLIIIIIILTIIISLNYKQDLISSIIKQFSFGSEEQVLNFDEQNIEEKKVPGTGYLELTYKSDNFDIELIDRMNFTKENYMPFPVISDKNGYFYTKFSWKKNGIQSSKIVDGEIQDIEFLSMSFYDFSIDGDYLYVAALRQISVYKLEEGKMLKEFSIPVNESFVSIVAKNGILYGANKNGLYAFENKENDLKKMAFLEIGYIWDIYEDNGYIYMNKEGYGQMEVYRLVGNKFFNIDNLTNDNFRIEVIQPKHNKVFVGAGNDFYVYELNNNRLFDTQIDLPKFPVHLFINDNDILFYCDNGTNLWVYKISDDNAIQLAHFNTRKYPQSICATDSNLYVSYDNEIDIYQFSIEPDFDIDKEIY